MSQEDIVLHLLVMEMDIQEHVNFPTYVEEETMPTPELVDGIIFVVKPAEVAEGQLLLNPGG